jgi:hypothetical protein
MYIPLFNFLSYRIDNLRLAYVFCKYFKFCPQTKQQAERHVGYLGIEEYGSKNYNYWIFRYNLLFVFALIGFSVYLKELGIVNDGDLKVVEKKAVEEESEIYKLF